MTANDPGPRTTVPRSRGPGRPRDARHDQAILAATLRILQEKGYGGLTIEGVAARAGVGRPTIYRRWPSKPALVVAALVQSARLAVPVLDTGSLRRDLIARPTPSGRVDERARQSSGHRRAHRRSRHRPRARRDLREPVPGAAPGDGVAGSPTRRRPGRAGRRRRLRLRLRPARSDHSSCEQSCGASRSRPTPRRRPPT